MIFVDQKNAPQPANLWWHSSRESAIKEAADFFKDPEKARRQERYEFARIEKDSSVRGPVKAAFHGKCAYCETPLESDWVVDHFRPKTGAVGTITVERAKRNDQERASRSQHWTDVEIPIDKTYAPDHYWWLAYEWTNLYPCCSECSSIKGAHFPVVGERAPPRVGGRRLDIDQQEKRLLIDPGRDDTFEGLWFAPDGRVESRSPRGAITIQVLELNRRRLIRARHDSIERLRKLVASTFRGASTWIDDFSEAASKVRLDEKLPAALAGPTRIREFLRQLFRNFPDPRSISTDGSRLLEMFDRDAPFIAGLLQPFVDLLRGRPEPWRSFLLKRSPFHRSVAVVGPRATAIGGTVVGKVSLAKPVPRPRRAQRTARSPAAAAAAVDRKKTITPRIRSVFIKNFKSIRALKLEFGPGRDGATPWLVLLGENGCGKSSALQAVAIALMGEAQRRKLKLDARKFLRKGETSGLVRVRLAQPTRKVVLEFDGTSARFKSTPREPRMLLLGYGATRLLPRKRATRFKREGPAIVENLFDPFAPLLDAAGWMPRLKKGNFDFVARSVKDVLALSRSARLVQPTSGRQEVQVEMNGKKHGLDELSDGYQSVIGLTADLIQGLRAENRGGLEAAEGIVLLDELGSHLHPSWRLQIVARMRRAFPRLQFLVTTHDPLCLRGLADGEVIVLRRTRLGRVYSIERPELPSIEPLRIDQILQSEYFGLSSTIDPAVQQEFEQYYRLLAKDSPSDDEKAEIRELSKRLTPSDVRGATERERLMLKAIDRYLARTRDEPDPDERRGESERLDRDLDDIAERPRRRRRRPDVPPEPAPPAVDAS